MNKKFNLFDKYPKILKNDFLQSKMEQKQKYFILGLIIGFGIPITEHVLASDIDPDRPFEKFVVFGEKLWLYFFLYIVLINSVLLYFKRLRVRINPESRGVFLITGTSFGFAFISIIAATIESLNLSFR